MTAHCPSCGYATIYMRTQNKKRKPKGILWENTGVQRVDGKGILWRNENV